MEQDVLEAGGYGVVPVPVSRGVEGREEQMRSGLYTLRLIPSHTAHADLSLFLELARLQSDNREAASYNDTPEGDSPAAEGSEDEGTDQSASD